MSKLTGFDTKTFSDAEAQSFKRDVKLTKKGKGIGIDYEFDNKTGQMTVKNYINSNNTKVVAAYARAVLSKAQKEKTVAQIRNTLLVTAGAGYLASRLG